MKSLILLGVCCSFVCLVNGYAAGQASAGCATTLSALPPDPNTGCCGVQAHVDDKLISGPQAAADQYPWLALIEFEKDGKIKTPCGGALISARYVLTAAHCVVEAAKYFSAPKNVRLGEYDITTDGPDCVPVAGGTDCTDGAISIPIEKTIAHPEYKDRQNDIALVKMKENAPYTDFIRPLCLPTVDMTQLKDPFNLILAGWSKIPSGTNSIKQQMQLPYAPLDKCQEVYKGSRKATLIKGQLCAGGEKGKDACKGDGGLPLFYENKNTEAYEAIGIVSFGPSPCGLENIPSVYTNVYEYKSWIMSNIVA